MNVYDEVNNLAKAIKESKEYNEYKKVKEKDEPPVEERHYNLVQEWNKSFNEKPAESASSAPEGEGLRDLVNPSSSDEEFDSDEYDEDDEDELMTYIPEPYPDGEYPDPYVISENDMLTCEETINEIVVYDPVNDEFRLPVSNEVVEEEDLELYFGPAIELIRNRDGFVDGHLFLRNEKLQVDFDISWEDEE